MSAQGTSRTDLQSGVSIPVTDSWHARSKNSPDRPNRVRYPTLFALDSHSAARIDPTRPAKAPSA